MEKKQTHIMYGFIMGILMAAVGAIIYLAGLAFRPGMQYVSYIPFLGGIILNAMAYSKANDGFVTFGNVFGSCFKASMIVALVMTVWSFLMMYIFPNMKDEAMTFARQQMAKNPQMTDDMMDTAMNMTKKYWTVIMVASAIFSTLFFGAIFSLIGGLVAKKNGSANPVID